MKTRTGIAVFGAALLGGCGSISSAIAPPEMTPISNPATVAGSSRVSMPLPAPRAAASAPNSLWRTGAKAVISSAVRSTKRFRSTRRVISAGSVYLGWNFLR